MQGTEKETGLYRRLVRLAHANPEMQEHLIPLLRRTATEGSMKDALQGAVDQFSEKVCQEMLTLLQKEVTGRGNKAWTDLKVAAPNRVEFKVGGVGSGIRVFFNFSGRYSGPNKGIEVFAEIKGKEWRGHSPLNMDRDAASIASTALFSIPSKMLP